MSPSTKFLSFSCAVAICASFSGAVYANSSLSLDGPESSSARITSSAESKRPGLSGLWPEAPEWLSRVYVEGSLSSDSNPNYSIETIQPLWQPENKNQAFFTQLRTGYRSGNWTMNAGLGYRYLTPDQQWLLGGNTFFDTQLNDAHRRLGFGAEVMQSYLTFRSNLYKSLTGWKVVEEHPTYIVSERALSGVDAGLEGPIPYLPYLRLEASYYHWGATVSDDINGINAKLKMAVSSNLSVDLGGSHDNDGNAVYVNLRFSPGSSRSNDSTFTTTPFSAKAFEPRDLKAHMLDRVERHNDIVTERKVTATGSVSGVRIVIRRGS